MSKSFLERVKSSLADLHPSERKLAELVLDFPGEIAGYTATEIAELAEVSNATVSRFVRRIGYESFDEARRAVRDEQKNGTALLRFSHDTADSDGVVARHYVGTQQNLEMTYSELDEAALDQLVHAMNAAGRVWCIGFRAGQTFAQYLGWQTSQVLSSVTVLPRAGETLPETLASLSKDDVVILFALRRTPKIVETVINTVHASGAALAVVSDRTIPAALQAEWQITCKTSASGPLMNHVAVMAVCNLLSARTVEVSGAPGRSRMAAIEDSHRQFGEL